jgi:hypothetical protein
VVSLAEGQYDNRFFLNFRSEPTGIIDLPAESDLFSIYNTQGTLKLKIDRLPGAEGTLLLSNLTGQTLLISKYYGQGYYEINHGLKDGIYIATFVSGTQHSSKKIYIRNH